MEVYLESRIVLNNLKIKNNEDFPHKTFFYVSKSECISSFKVVRGRLG
jgi:hypothetical protein